MVRPTTGSPVQSDSCAAPSGVVFKIHIEGDKFTFEVLDGEESLHVGAPVSKEATAERRAKAWVNKYNKASKQVRAKMCGYDFGATFTPTPRKVLKRCTNS